MQETPAGIFDTGYLTVVTIAGEFRGLSSVSVGIQSSPRQQLRDCMQELLRRCSRMHKRLGSTVLTNPVPNYQRSKGEFNVEKLDTHTLSFWLSFKIMCLSAQVCDLCYVHLPIRKDQVGSCYKECTALPPHSACFSWPVFELDAVKTFQGIYKQCSLSIISAQEQMRLEFSITVRSLQFYHCCSTGREGPPNHP